MITFKCRLASSLPAISISSSRSRGHSRSISSTKSSLVRLVCLSTTLSIVGVLLWSGVGCGTVSSNTTPFFSIASASTTSAFVRRCDGSNFSTFQQASSTCSGAGEYLAAPRNAEELAAVLALATPNNVIGGIITSSNAWKWLQGPFADTIYYIGGGKGSVGPMDFPYNAAAILTGTSGTLFTVTTGSGDFLTKTMSPFPSGVQCSICQRITDCRDVCSSFGTQSFSGTAHANCVCVCRPGYTGKYCDYQTSYFCQSTIINPTSASASCASKGGFLATPTTLALMGELRAQYNYSSGTNVLIGGDDVAVEGQWLWSGGPNAGRQFWEGLGGGIVKNGYTSYFSTGEPNDYNHPTFPGGEDSLCFKDFMWNDCNVNGNVVKCYVCQFSVCNSSSPCVGANTLSATGTQYGDCTCTCKPGFGGPFCQCPQNGCDSRGGNLIQGPNSCSCVCKPNYNGVNCSERTVTEPHTLTAPISNTTSLILTPTETNLHTTSHSRPPTSSTTPTLSRVTISQTVFPTHTVSEAQTLTRTGPSQSYLTNTYTNNSTTTNSLPTTSTPSFLSTISASLSATNSSQLTTTHSITLTASREETLSCPAMLWKSACDMLIWQLSGGNETVSNATTVATTNTTRGCMPTLFVPFSVWEKGDVRAAIRFPPSKLLPRAVAPPNATSSDVGAPTPIITITSLGAFARSQGELLEVVLQRRDDAGLGRAVHQVRLPNWLFGCGLPFTLNSEVVYEARPRNLAAKGVQDAGNGIGTASSVLTGSPGAVVRGGVMSTISGLMRCSRVDVTEEVSWLNNPMGISIGSVDGASLRGSVMSGFIFVIFGLMICIAVMAGTAGWAIVTGEAVPGWRELIARGRLPSSVVALVALGMEVGTGSAMTLLTMGTEFGGIGDRIGGVVYILAAAVYCGHVCSTCIRAPVHAVEVPALPIGSTKLRKLTKYVFQPTHELKLNGCVEAEDSDLSKKAQGVRDREWVRRNAFYTADLRWPLFRGIELFVGLAANLVEGFAAGGKTGCVARILLMIVALVGTIVLLLVTRACSIRAMLWSTVLLNALMAVAAVLALVNVMASNPEVEEAADWLLMGASIIIVVQSTIDIILTAVTVIPATRSCFGYLRKRFGEDINGVGDDLLFSGTPAPLLEIIDADLDADMDMDDPNEGYTNAAFSPPQSPTMCEREVIYVDHVSSRVSKAPLEHSRGGEGEEVEVDHQVEWIYAQPTSHHHNDFKEDGNSEAVEEEDPKPHRAVGRRRHEVGDDDHIPEDFLKYLEENGFSVNNNDDGQEQHPDNDDVYNGGQADDDEELEELLFRPH